MLTNHKFQVSQRGYRAWRYILEWENCSFFERSTSSCWKGKIPWHVKSNVQSHSSQKKTDVKQQPNTSTRKQFSKKPQVLMWNSFHCDSEDCFVSKTLFISKMGSIVQQNARLVVNIVKGLHLFPKEFWYQKDIVQLQANPSPSWWCRWLSSWP